MKLWYPFICVAITCFCAGQSWAKSGVQLDPSVLNQIHLPDMQLAQREPPYPPPPPPMPPGEEREDECHRCRRHCDHEFDDCMRYNHDEHRCHRERQHCMEDHCPRCY
jgi:hypothetical protein